MAKFIGNQGGSDSYPTTKSPSTHDRSAVEGGFTSNFPADKVTHSHMTPKGERDFEGQRQYRTPSYEQEKHGSKLDRATPRQGIYGDRAERAGKIGSGFEGGSQKSNRMGDDADHGSPLAAALLRGEDPWSR